jgi:hypothetical protein
MILSACGGGGGGGSGGGGSDTPPSTPSPSLTLNQTTLTVTADTSSGAPPPSVVQVSIANAPVTGLQYAVTLAGTQVASATFTAQTAATGQLTVGFAAPAQLGAGTYTETVQLSACYDTACTRPITGSPATLSVTYTVTGSSLPPPSFYLVTVFSGIRATTGQSSPQTLDLDFNVKNVPPAGLYVKITQPSNGFIATVTDTVEPVSDGSTQADFVVTLVSPASLGSGFFSSSITFMICYDQACSNQIPGSPVTQPVYYNIFLTQGIEYSLVNASLASYAGGVTDLAYDSANGQIYVSALASNTLSGSTGDVVPVDPTTGNAGTPAPFNDSLSTIAVSDDGSYLYTGSSNNPVVHRLQLPSLQADLDIPLGSSGDPNTGGGANITAEMAVAPGAPLTLAVSLGHPNSHQTAGTEIFDGAVARTQWLAPLGYYAAPDAIAWSDTASLLYAYRYSPEIPFDQEIDSVLVNSTGLSVQSAVSVTGGPDPVGQIFYDQGRIYDLGGYVRNAATGALVGQFQMPGNQPSNPVNDQIEAMVPDGTHGRAFFLVHNGQSSHLYLYNFDSTSFALLGAIDLGYDSFDVTLATHLILWGTNGVATNRLGLQFLSGSFYTAPTVTTSQVGQRAGGKRQLRALRILPKTT